MKPEAKAKLSEIVDIVQKKEFWRTAKCLVELSVPAMYLLRLADSGITESPNRRGPQFDRIANR